MTTQSRIAARKKGDEKMKESLFTAKQIEKMVAQLAKEIDRKNEGKKLALIGIRTRGVALAERLRAALEKSRGEDILFGVLDITLYRDDLGLHEVQPVVRSTEIDFDVTDKAIVLVDDVLFTGRTIRAALDAIVDFGRPESVQLAVLVDRGNRQFPIQADFLCEKVKTEFEDRVKVSMKEVDDEDGISIVKK